MPRVVSLVGLAGLEASRRAERGLQLLANDIPDRSEVRAREGHPARLVEVALAARDRPAGSASRVDAPGEDCRMLSRFDLAALRAIVRDEIRDALRREARLERADDAPQEPVRRVIAEVALRESLDNDDASVRQTVRDDLAKLRARPPRPRDPNAPPKRRRRTSRERNEVAFGPYKHSRSRGG